MESLRESMRSQGWLIAPCLLAASMTISTGVVAPWRVGVLAATAIVPILVLRSANVLLNTHACRVVPFASSTAMIAGSSVDSKRLVSGFFLGVTGWLSLFWSISSIGLLILAASESNILLACHVLALSVHVVCVCVFAWGLMILKNTGREMKVVVPLALIAIIVTAALKEVVYG